MLGDLVQAYANAFNGEKGACNPTVRACTTALAIQDITEGRVQIAMASRKMLDNERSLAVSKGVQLAEKYIGKTRLPY